MFKNFCRCNAAVSDLYNNKSKNKIGHIFFLIPMADILLNVTGIQCVAQVELKFLHSCEGC